MQTHYAYCIYYVDRAPLCMRVSLCLGRRMLLMKTGTNADAGRPKPLAEHPSHIHCGRMVAPRLRGNSGLTCLQSMHSKQ